MNIDEPSILKALELLNLSIEDIEPLLSLGEALSLDANETYYFQGHRKPQIAFIVSGLLRGYYITSDGKESTYVLRTNNDIIACWEVILLDIPSNHAVEAVVSTEIISFDYTKIKAAINKNTKLQDAFIIKLQQLYGQSLLHYQAFVNEKPEERYLRLIESKPNIIEVLPQKIMASYLGITPESFSRMKKRLIDEDKIDENY